MIIIERVVFRATASHTQRCRGGHIENLGLGLVPGAMVRGTFVASPVIQEDTMRVMLKAELPVEATNPRIKDGSVPGVIASIMERLKPEAAYFGPVNGTRTAVLFLNIEDPSEIPAIVEPWFLAFEADVEVTPMMNAEDLMKAEAGIQEAVKTYG